VKGDGGSSVEGDKGCNSSPSVLLLLTTGALVLATAIGQPQVPLSSRHASTRRATGEKREYIYFGASAVDAQLFFGGALEIVLAIVIITVTGSNRVLLHA
jgi:hypothetical protein